MLIASLALIIGGAVIYRIGVRGENGELPRQRVAGLRTRATLSSDDAWYAAQKAGADLVKAAGALAVIGGLTSIPVYDQLPVAAALVLGTTAVMLSLVVWGGVRGQAAARTVSAQSASDHHPMTDTDGV